MPLDRVALIRERLTAALSPAELHIEDDSWRHAGHAGAAGGGHFSVRIVSEAFRGLTPIKRHRLVYAALGDTMRTEIHALQIEAAAPGE